MHTLYNCILILYRHSRKNLFFIVLCDAFRDYSPSIKKVSQLDLLIKI